MNDDHYLTRLHSIVSSVTRQGTVTVFGKVPETALDALRKYGIRILPSSDAIGTTVLAFSHLDTEDKGVSAFFDRIDGTENVVVFGRRTKDKATLEKIAFSKGYRYHPAYFAHVDYEDRFDDGFWSLLQRVPAVAGRPLEDDGYEDATRDPSPAAYGQMARYAFLTRFVRPGDTVLDRTCGTGYGANIVRTLSECAAVVGRTSVARLEAYASVNFPQKGLAFETGDPHDLSDHGSESVDVVVSFATLVDADTAERSVGEAARVLRPGGRLLLGVQFGPHHITKPDLVATVRRFMEIEELWGQDASFPTMSKISADGDGPETAWLLIVAYKRPEPTVDAPEFRDTIYSYPDPTRNFLSFARDYRNPLLMRTLFGFGVRVSNADGRDRIARKTLSDAPSGSADRGAALCVIGYRLLETGSPSDIRAFIEEATTFGKGHPLSPHAFRWSVSLSFLAGVMEQRLGNHDRAITAFDTVLESDWLGFSPTLGTKAAEAAYRAGLIRLAQKDLLSARDYWASGLDVAKRIMSSDWSEIVGDERCPLPDSMRESIMALEIARKCGDCLRLTSGHEYRSDYAAWRTMIDDQSMAASRSLAVMQASRAAGEDAAKWRRLRARLMSNPVASWLVGALKRFRGKTS